MRDGVNNLVTDSGNSADRKDLMDCEELVRTKKQRRRVARGTHAVNAALVIGASDPGMMYGYVRGETSSMRDERCERDDCQ